MADGRYDMNTKHNPFKIIISLSIFLALMIGVNGCMFFENKPTRIEENDEYVQMMHQYIQDKYNVNFDIKESILPEEGFNTGMKENILVVTDENGVSANVKAYLSTPYEYSDDYVYSLAADKIQKSLDLTDIEKHGCCKVYTVTNSSDPTDIDISADNIASLTFVAVIDHSSDDDALDILYDVYSQIQTLGYADVYFLVAFSSDLEYFSKVVLNYTVYGQTSWSDYPAEISAYMNVMDNDLSKDAFTEELHAL